MIATATLAGLTEGEDYTRVEQDFDMSELLTAQDGCEASDTDCVDVAEAMIYNEYAQLLETTNPDTGELFTPADLNVLNYNDYGTAMLQDALWARASWLARKATRTSRSASCGPHSAAGSTAVTTRRLRPYSLDRLELWGQGHLAWMMNEINDLVWPSPWHRRAGPGGVGSDGRDRDRRRDPHRGAVG